MLLQKLDISINSIKKVRIVFIASIVVLAGFLLMSFIIATNEKRYVFDAMIQFYKLYRFYFPFVILFISYVVLILLYWLFNEVCKLIKLASENENLNCQKIDQFGNSTCDLLIANKELAFQIDEKEKKSKELIVANKELAFQNKEREKRADELWLANKELEYQNLEKAKRAEELFQLNRELELFVNISSHDLQEPLRKMQIASSRIIGDDYSNLSAKGKEQFEKMQDASMRMQTLIEDLLSYSKVNNQIDKMEQIDFSLFIEEVKEEYKESCEEINAMITTKVNGKVQVHTFQFRQLFHNLINNSIKFSHLERNLIIEISNEFIFGKEVTAINLVSEKKYCHIVFKDNGIGFDSKYNDKIFEVFQRLHGREVYRGNGIGLAIVKKIIDFHQGVIVATGELGVGAQFDIYIPIV